MWASSEFDGKNNQEERNSAGNGEETKPHIIKGEELSLILGRETRIHTNWAVAYCHGM